MITKVQEEWITQLGDNPVYVVPYDSRSERLFEVVKKRVQSVLGQKVVIEHSGASSLEISGQDEIDISVVAENQERFAEYIPALEKEFGPVKKRYPDRARFEVREEGKKIDLKVVDAQHLNYLEGKRFEAHLRQHPEALERYRFLKESLSGMSTKEYYRTKIEFINEILSKAK